MKELFEQALLSERQNNTNSISRIDENRFQLEGGKYSIIYNQEESSLTLKRNQVQVILIRLDCQNKNNQINIARGLTEHDQTQWQQLRQLLENQAGY
jgi:hypothetical protein